MKPRTAVFITLLLLWEKVPSETSLKPGSSQLGTKEDSKLITSLALWYVETRNIVRDSYNTIQYTRAMVDNLSRMKDWYERNKRGWAGVGDRMTQLVTEPGRWDEKLQEAAQLFDAIDYQLFDETKRLDILVSKQEHFFGGATGSARSALKMNHPRAQETIKELSLLYGVNADEVWKNPNFSKDDAAMAIYKANEGERRLLRNMFVRTRQDEKLSQATHIVISQALSRIATIKRMQKKRALNYQEYSDAIKAVKGTNILALNENLAGLHETSNMLDAAILDLIQLEILFNEVGMQLYEKTSVKASQLRATSGIDDLIAGASGKN